MSDHSALDAVRGRLKLSACPHCRQTGALIGHGYLRGYAERSSEVAVRGRRVFCSNRARSAGCGRTFSVSIAAVLCGFVLRTLTLWLFAQAVVEGLTRRAAWLRATQGTFSLSSGYRVWRRLREAQCSLRARLCRQQPAPVNASREPLAQLFTHICEVVRAGTATPPNDPFSAYQLLLQRGLFEP